MKKFGNTVCRIPMSSSESTKPMHSDPPYNRQSHFVTCTSNNQKSTVSGDNTFIESVLHDESQYVCDKVSTSASTVSTTVAYINSGSETVSG